jgi:hypothetical protein
MDHLLWLLDRIQWLEELNSAMRPPTHKCIWQGSYDVWECEQDRLDSINIPLANMKLAEESGLIKSEIRTVGKYEMIVWGLTDVGREFLRNSHARQV